MSRRTPPAAPRVLHVFANYKWTGPADPAIRTAWWSRRDGLDARFAISGFVHRGGEHRMAEELWQRGMPVVTGMQLRKHFHPVATFRDVRVLRRLLRRDRYDVVHCHLLGDHLTAALALGPRRPGRPLLVRSCYDVDPPRRDWRAALAFARTDGAVLPTPDCAAAFAKRFPQPQRLLQEPPIDAWRARRQDDLRERWAQQLPVGGFLIGITARIQPHRRFELLWEVARRVTAARDHVRFVLLGRGNERDTEQLVREPVRRLGLGRHVLLPGYLREPDYSAALRSLDAFLFLVPGSDGTCRAVREVLPLGVPVVATQRGVLPHLLGAWGDGAVGTGRAAVGLVRSEIAEDLAGALLQLVDDAALRLQLGAAARDRALGPMDPAAASRRLVQFYAELAGAEPVASSEPGSGPA